MLEPSFVSLQEDFHVCHSCAYQLAASRLLQACRVPAPSHFCHSHLDHQKAQIRKKLHWTKDDPNQMTCYHYVTVMISSPTRLVTIMLCYVAVNVTGTKPQIYPWSIHPRDKTLWYPPLRIYPWSIYPWDKTLLPPPPTCSAAYIDYFEKAVPVKVCDTLDQTCQTGRLLKHS